MIVSLGTPGRFSHFQLPVIFGAVLLFQACAKLPEDYDISEGDILFQSLKESGVVIAIEAARMQT
jgi:hypothetical protein